jgi:hypothetical protein
VQGVLIAFAGWMAGREPARRSGRIKAGLAKRAARGKPAARQPVSKDTKARKRSGYVAAWEQGGARRRTGGESRHDYQERPDCRSAAGAGLRRRARHALRDGHPLARARADAGRRLRLRAR